MGELRKMFVREDDRLKAAGVTGDGSPMRSRFVIAIVANLPRLAEEC